MNKRQAAYWVGRFRLLPGITWARVGSYEDGTYFVHLRFVDEGSVIIDDTCHARTLYHINVSWPKFP